MLKAASDQSQARAGSPTTLLPLLGGKAAAFPKAWEILALPNSRATPNPPGHGTRSRRRLNRITHPSSSCPVLGGCTPHHPPRETFPTSLVGAGEGASPVLGVVASGICGGGRVTGDRQRPARLPGPSARPGRSLPAPGSPLTPSPPALLTHRRTQRPPPSTGVEQGGRRLFCGAGRGGKGGNSVTPTPCRGHQAAPEAGWGTGRRETGRGSGLPCAAFHPAPEVRRARVRSGLAGAREGRYQERSAGGGWSRSVGGGSY